MSRLFRALSVAALASSATLAHAQQPIPTSPAQPVQIQPARPGQVVPGQVVPGQVAPGQVTPAQHGGPAHAGMNAQGVDLNAFIAHQLKRGNEAEVELGQMASQRAKTDSVKEFANMMVKSHQEMIQKLEPFDQGIGAGRGNNATRDNTSNSREQPNAQERNNEGDRPNNANRPGNSSNIAPVDGARNNVRNSESNTDDDPRAADRNPTGGTSQASSGSGSNTQTTATPGGVPAARAQQAGQVNPQGQPNQGQPNQGQLNQQGPQNQPARMGGMSGHVPHMLVALEDQACDNELQLTKQMLEKHEGEDFEMAYIGQQIVAHTCMLAKLQALKNSGPQELQPLVTQGEQTTRQHLDQAMKIAKELGEDKK